MKKPIIASISALLLLPAAYAHCPLCTISAGVVAGFAAWMGVSKLVIGLFIGAFGASLGWWLRKYIKKTYVPFQNTLIILFSFATTIVPLLPVIPDASPLYISLAGDYGSLLNRTYVINQFIVGSLIGLLLISITPLLSKTMTRIRGTALPFQGMLLTAGLLLIIGILMQVFS
ncbi:hypothetical protein HY491_00795 [Candidatus Woesearchaeota archaeon]|nr:hypothetical protein [Candidatus Woesearchaeota archaeon]